jgi:hypothetical protein
MYGARSNTVNMYAEQLEDVVMRGDRIWTVMFSRSRLQ